MAGGIACLCVPVVRLIGFAGLYYAETGNGGHSKLAVMTAAELVRQVLVHLLIFCSNLRPPMVMKSFSPGIGIDIYVGLGSWSLLHALGAALQVADGSIQQI
jgi:hypothetical protein